MTTNNAAAEEETFDFEGYTIPTRLMTLTGGGADTWEIISLGHMHAYAKYCAILPQHSVLEIGCGVGRDAIQLAKLLNERGSYVGIDIIRPSIEWCQENISTRHPNFRFHCLDIYSQIHNPGGTLSVRDVRLPVASRSIDRIILQSVFTHMFEPDIIHYLREFRRALRPTGRIFASVFLLDPDSLEMARRPDRTPTVPPLRFETPYGPDCYIDEPTHPEGAVGFTPVAVQRMLSESGLVLDQPVHHGFWCGRSGVEDGQDILVLRPSSQYPLLDSAVTTGRRMLGDLRRGATQRICRALQSKQTS